MSNQSYWHSTHSVVWLWGCEDVSMLACCDSMKLRAQRTWLRDLRLVPEALEQFCIWATVTEAGCFRPLIHLIFGFSAWVNHFKWLRSVGKRDTLVVCQPRSRWVPKDHLGNKHVLFRHFAGLQNFSITWWSETAVLLKCLSACVGHAASPSGHLSHSFNMTEFITPRWTRLLTQTCAASLDRKLHLSRRCSLQSV